MTTSWKAMIVSGFVLAAMALVFTGVRNVQLQSKLNDTNQELSSAQEQVDQISGDLSVLKAETASSGSGIGKSVDDLVAQVKLINDCIPELQAEVTSETYYSSGSYITPSVQLSRYCSDLIYGGSTGVTGE